MLLPSEGSTDFIRPYLDSLTRVRERSLVQPGVMRDRAERLLRDTFGASEASIDSAFAIGQIGVISEHTYYFDGFALMLPLPFGTAVAVRRAPAPDAWCVIEGSPRTYPMTMSAEDLPHVPSAEDGEATLAEQSAGALRGVVGDAGPCQLAVVTDIPPFCEDGYFASLVLAARRAMGAGVTEPDEVREMATHVRELLGRPYGVAPLLGAAYCETGRALLVDTQTIEHIPIDLPDSEKMVWALVDTKAEVKVRASVYRQRLQATAEVVAFLLKNELAGPDGIRDLEHRHLQLALKQLPKRLHPVLRYLVTENRRVQRLVVALRQGDAQMFGAFLQMSQAAISNDWNERNPAVEHVQALAEEVDGVEGVRRVGREFGSGVMLTGRPLAMMPLIDRLSGESTADDGPDVRSYLL